MYMYDSMIKNYKNCIYICLDIFIKKNKKFEKKKFQTSIVNFGILRDDMTPLVFHILRFAQKTYYYETKYI